VENLVHIELSYINTNHPDFSDGASVVSSMLAANDLVYFLLNILAKLKVLQHSPREWGGG